MKYTHYEYEMLIHSRTWAIQATAGDLSVQLHHMEQLQNLLLQYATDVSNQVQGVYDEWLSELGVE